MLNCSFLYAQATTELVEMRHFENGGNSLVLEEQGLPQTRKERNSRWLERCGICEGLVGRGGKLWRRDGAWKQHLREGCLVV